jgi:hypothetical protein
MNDLYLLAQSGFAILTVVFYGLLLNELKIALHASTLSAERKKKIFNGTLLGIVLWMIATGILSWSGVLSDFTSFPPRLFIVLIIPLATIIWIITRKVTGEILQHIPAVTLIRLQVFRVFVEVLLWALFIGDLLPVQMTFEGRNFDILAGITAPLIAWLYLHNKVSKTVVITWNLICLGLLINIVAVAIGSIPSPFRVFLNEPANTIVARFPIVWLPALLVPLAYGLHFLSLKQLLRKDE